jgi:hypothetical protein
MWQIIAASFKHGPLAADLKKPPAHLPGEADAEGVESRRAAQYRCKMPRRIDDDSPHVP